MFHELGVHRLVAGELGGGVVQTLGAFGEEVDSDEQFPATGQFLWKQAVVRGVVAPDRFFHDGSVMGQGDPLFAVAGGLDGGGAPALDSFPLFAVAECADV